MIVKICGITNPDDARVALAAGADLIGLNLVTGPRKIDTATAEKIVAALPDPAAAVVLFAPGGGAGCIAPLDGLLNRGVRWVQLYDTYAVEAAKQLHARGAQIAHVESVADEGSLDEVDAFLTLCPTGSVGAVVLDAHEPGKLGGTGAQADWVMLAKARKAGRFNLWPAVWLAGGLRPANVATAIGLVQPAGVDVSSGVEVSPGRKDAELVRDFVAAVRSVHRSEASQPQDDGD